MVYNESLLSNSTGIVEILKGVSEASGGGEFLIGNLILFTFALLFLIVTYREGDLMNSVAVAAFITSILSMLFFYAGLIAQTTIIYPFIILMITLVLQFIKSRY